ncbi:MAG: NUDIX hydrolase [Bacillota bacterium]|nr:NUDIX hydrolase [Bacillota bacterium]
MEYYEKTLSKKHIYTGGIIELDVLEVELPDGNISKRDIVSHPGAAVVIPISSDGEIYMVRQYRKPIERITLEIPAGKLDPGEEPLDCAKRELMEETGLTAKHMKHLTSIHSTPGFSNEILHMYAAVDLKEGQPDADPDEFISCEKLPVKQLIQMVMTNQITDAKTIIGILLAEKIIKGEIEAVDS